MTIENNKKYKLTGEQIKDLASRFGVLSGEIGDLANLTTTDKTNLVAAINEAAAEGGGGIIELTSADYNYPTDNPTQIAAWLLPDGIYHSASTAIQWSAYGDSAVNGTFIKTTNSSNMAFVFFYRESGLNEVILSQALGSTHYTNLSTSSVKQSTGTSTTDVMSQNAVTSMVFADPSTRYKVQIGNNAVTSGAGATSIGGATRGTGNYSVAIGNSTRTTGANSVALGSGADASQKGQFDISTSFSGSTLGYNDTQYRLLTGLYDGQSAHDAATKGQLDSIAIQNAGAPTTATVGTVGQLLEDTTNGKLYICTAIVPGTDPDPDTYTWTEVGTGGGGSGVIELTSSDYNYHSSGSTDDGVALWLLDAGVYVVPSSESLKIYYGSGYATESGVSSEVYIITPASGSTKAAILITPRYLETLVTLRYTNLTTGACTYEMIPNVVQSTGVSTTTVMSQNAVTSMVFADPASKEKVRISSTDSSMGSLAVAIGSGSLSRSEGSISIGQSAHVYGSGTYSIAIGNESSAGNNARAVALGNAANAAYQGSIAIGSNSATTAVGEMNIGSSNTSYGYNSSNYRLLTGLYDPQSDHDAATKGYVDPTTDSSAPTTATVGRLGQIQIDTTTATAYMCVAVDTVTPAYTWKQITA